MKVPFSPPRIDQKTIDAVNEVLRSGWITTGPKTKLFEQRLAEFTQSKKVICLNSATAGLELALKWFGIGPEDEVILPAYTYCSTANVIEHLGAKPVMVDVGDDFNIDIEQVKTKTSAKTKAIMPVDIGGNPCNYKALNKLLSAPEIKEKFKANNKKQALLQRPLILADAAHSVGATYNQKPAVHGADIAVHSFHAVKNLITAEGGAVYFNLPEEFDHELIYKEFNTLSLHGQNKDALAKFKKGGWKYDVTHAGYKCNLTDIASAIGLVELERYKETLEKRRAIVEYYHRYFSDFEWYIPPTFKTKDKESSYHLFMLRIKGIDEQTRDAIIEEISKQDVAVNVHFQPLPLLSYYKNKGYDIKDYPNAYKQYAQEISLPVFYDLTQEQQEYVCSVVSNCVNKSL